MPGDCVAPLSAPARARGRRWEACTHGHLAWSCWTMTDAERRAYFRGDWGRMRLVQSTGLPRAAFALHLDDGASCAVDGLTPAAE